ncbi:MAG: uroporphyrinogen-III C-methyltransferase, partial [Candidatus Regiella insecticola]|nr:uroporphyrinogen-III C-methyltransferase [Candidatus Regiella insecticola]
VKMAERKLWNDQDATSAVILLKNGDTSLADMHDASLIEIRRAIIEDIRTLSTLSQIDFDGIILKLNQLSNQ